MLTMEARMVTGSRTKMIEPYVYHPSCAWTIFFDFWRKLCRIFEKHPFWILFPNNIIFKNWIFADAITSFNFWNTNNSNTCFESLLSNVRFKILMWIIHKIYRLSEAKIWSFMSLKHQVFRVGAPLDPEFPKYTYNIMIYNFTPIIIGFLIVFHAKLNFFWYSRYWKQFCPWLSINGYPSGSPQPFSKPIPIFDFPLGEFRSQFFSSGGGWLQGFRIFGREAPETAPKVPF